MDFRLIDFHIYDDSNTASSGSSGSDEEGIKSKKDLHFVIQMFGVNELGETVSIFVDDYQPFFYCKLPDSANQSYVTKLLEYIKERKDMLHYKDDIVSAKCEEYNKLYGFTGGKKSKFAKFTFKNTVAMRKMKNIWFAYENGERKSVPFYYKNNTLVLYESNIPPLLRYFHIQNISPSGWITFDKKKVMEPDVKTTTCTYEFICSCDTVQPKPEKETPVPYKICSFDIEASSSHGDFPIPIKTYKRLASNIVDVFINEAPMYLKMKDKEKKYELMLQTCILTAFASPSKKPKNNIDLVYPIKKVSEKKLKELIEKFSIDVFTFSNANIHEKMSIENIFQDKNKVFDNDSADIDGDNTDDATMGVDEDEGRAVVRKEKKRDITKFRIIELLVSETNREDKIINLTYAFEEAQFPPLKGDEVTFIGSTFMRYGEPEPYLNHCLVVGTCDPVDGAEIVSVNDENELLVKWTQLIQDENPDIIIGYNIFGFDYEFMFRRAQENHCLDDFLKFSRRKGELSANEIVSRDGSPNRIEIEHTKVVFASGEFDLHYFKMTGRLQIDMYSYFRRDFNLSSYKLDDVAGMFISDDICHIEYSSIGTTETTHLYSMNLMGLHVGDFIHIEITKFTTDYYEDGRKFVVLDIIRGVERVDKKGKTVSYNIIVIEGHHIICEKSIKWTMSKDDVTPQDIFRLTKDGGPSGRAKVAKYCIQDCNLVHHLMNKIDVITGYVEMSRICSVPISFLVFRGQGIKLTSYVAKKCLAKKTLMPDLEKSKGNDGYEGAIVLPPKCAMYIDNPVACVDYSSLYPSSMISQNYSHDSKVWSKEYDLDGNLIRVTGERGFDGEFLYDNLKGYEYIDVEFDTYEYRRKSATSAAVKTKVGKMIVRWAQLPDDQKSIMPSILEELLKARSDTRKLSKTVSDPFMQNILDKRQIGYKVTANSLYGQCGSKTSTFYEKDVAACTTATGRMMITYARRIVEEVYGDRLYETVALGPIKCHAEYVYGDSVANYTPVKVRVNGVPVICTIEELGEKYGQGKWVTCEEEGKQTKEFCELSGVESWTENGWTKLHRIIRHALASHKKMMRILTHTGLVDVTDDHSLIRSNGHEISPKDCQIGTELLHKDSELVISNDKNISIEEAYIMGFFFGDGSCGNYNCASGKKSSWALNNASMDILQKCLNYCEIVYPEFEWKILDTIESSGVYKICPKSYAYGSIVEFVRKYREKMYYSSCKIIPNEIMHSPIEIRKSFWNGMYDADGDKDANGYVRIDQKNQLSASHIAWLANSIGYKTSINTRADKPNVYRITMTNKTQRKNPCAIKKMHEIPYQGFVYDLTTENHHFAAGIGNLIVHNTDSVFFTFNLEDPKTKEKIRGRPALEATIEIAQDVAELCTSFLKPPMALAYEKTLMPFILLSKKRYVGMLYEEDPNKGKLKFMGLSLKRRDACDYLKDTYGGILNILMDAASSTNTIQLATNFLKTSLKNLIDGKVAMDKLAITKALRSDYKNPQSIAHRVLSDRIGRRDPGNKPKPGDRIKYLFVTNADKKALLGERVETPEFIVENRIKIDYMYYITNQLMKPLQQLFGLAVDQILEQDPNKKGTLAQYKKDIDIMKAETTTRDGEWDIETYMKKKEKYCSTKIKALLFEEFLQNIHNSNNGIRKISDMFAKK